MVEIVINERYGGFGLSDEAEEMYDLDSSRYYYGEHRDDYDLVRCVKEMGSSASSSCADLVVVELPDECTDWMVLEYDGCESVVYVVNGKLYRA